MNLRPHILLAAYVALSSCTTSVRTAGGATERQQTSEWMQHSQSTVPNLFGGKEDKKDVGDGFYEQAGSVASNSSWEVVAHYTYLAYHGVEIGNASYRIRFPHPADLSLYQRAIITAQNPTN